MGILVLSPTEILNYSSASKFPAAGKKGKIYIDTTENTIYRWDTSNSEYVQIGGGAGIPPAAGESF